MTSPNGVNGSTGGPWWARLLVSSSAPTILLAAVLGLIPGVRSPLDQRESFAAHRIETRRLIEVFELTCRGVWRGDADRQDDCTRASLGLLREQKEAP
jgi:hypothetical protein